jgi:hypothetical protein
MRTADFEIEKSMLVDNLNFLKGMTDRQYQLYKKHDELKHYSVLPSEIQQAKERLWNGDSIDTLKPKVVIIGKVEEDRENYRLWKIYRHFLTLGECNPSPARVIHFFVIDETTNKIIGIGNLVSDFFTLAPRDNFIGWTIEQRKNGALNNVAIGATIVPVQPFGYNFLGGKLVACLITSQVIRDEWKRRYNQTLVGMTTTSLYGAFSMYDRIPCWKALGETTGRVSIVPEKAIESFWRRWFRKQQADEYEKLCSISTTNQKARITRSMFSTVGLNPSDYNHNHKRGIYFSEFYQNAKDFLCGRINEAELLPPKKEWNVMEWWKPKAVARYNNLKQQNRLQTEQLWLDDIRSMKWDDVKTKYL